MRTAGQADCFVIVNGPEDGTEFPIVRTPFLIGNDSGCTVNIRLDKGVEAFHAHVSVVSDGYRVRRADHRPVLVNGKLVGALRSRIVRNGGMVQVGQTLIAVDCSPDGLARRSRGIVSESDFGWAIRTAATKLIGTAQSVAAFLYRTARRILTSWLAVASILALCYLFWPAFRAWVNWVVLWLYYRAAGAF
jgi:hypothetical protein